MSVSSLYMPPTSLLARDSATYKKSKVKSFPSHEASISLALSQTPAYTYTGLVHRVVCLFMSQFWLALIAPAH